MIYLTATLLTLVESWLGIALATAITLYYLLPPPPPVYVTEPQRRHAGGTGRAVI